MQLAIQSLLWRFIPLDSTLRELLSILPYTTRPQHLPRPVGQDNAYIRAEAVRVNHCLSPSLMIHCIVPQRRAAQQLHS